MGSQPPVRCLDLGLIFVALTFASCSSAVWAVDPDRPATDFDPLRPVRFSAQVMPTLTRLGCNSGSCHGKSGGQHGFALSLFGSNPATDHVALRVRSNPDDPPASLLILKPTGQMPHGGGARIMIDSPEYDTLIRWISQPEITPPAATEPRLIRLDPIPRRQTLSPTNQGQIRVEATWDDGLIVDVTRLSLFESSARPIVVVDPLGHLVAGSSVGEAAVLVKYAGAFAVARVVVPAQIPNRFPWESARSSYDELINRRLADLSLRPAQATVDAEFARRSSLDITGRLPDPVAVAAFEVDSRADKRARWIDGLLACPEYADFFAAKWAAILRNRRTLGDVSRPGTFAFHSWLRAAIAANWPYDRLVEAIVAGRGNAASNPAVLWYHNVGTLEARADDVAQVFLGTRIGCARCHHHPTEIWDQADHAGFAAFFARIGIKGGADPTTLTVFHQATDPRPDATLPRALGEPTTVPLGPRADPRDDLVRWMVRDENPYFARAVVNRYWKHFLGVGIVEPEDDLRVTNPPSNPALLDALAADFRAHDFDLKWLIGAITATDAYARSSLPDPSNPTEQGNFARQIPRRLSAEVLLDAIGTVTGTTHDFGGLPAGTYATQLPDDGFVSPFLDAFGRPERRTACECERSSDPNLGQALFLLNSAELEARIADPTGRAAHLASPTDRRPNTAKVREVYQIALSREPTTDELALSVAHLERQRQTNHAVARWSDLIWAILNTKEFLFNH